MLSAPSIKGSVLAGYVEELRKLVDSGAISREELARRLSPAEIETIEKRIQVSSWYSIQLYARIVEFLRDVQGDGKNEYLVKLGEESAERLLKAGLYQQLHYLKRAQINALSDPSERFAAFGRDLRLLTTVRGSILNFTLQEVKPDPDHADRYILEITEASACPDALCWTTLGFINRMAAEHGSPDLWRWERPRRDLVLYRMTRPV